MATYTRTARTAGTVSIAALACALAMPAAAQATDPQTTGTSVPTPQTPLEDPPVADDAVEDIVVTGFRASLDAALDVKRTSVSAVDAIVAEDIAKFPDQNLAESLQRIPGITIQRDGGEGRAITVRGLGSQFTRVRVNGMETVATSSDGATSNRDRAFDFNVFASELFNSIVVHKTAEASLDEGSLGAVVDLNTGNPLGGKTGFTIVGSATASYNDLADTVGPRVAGLASWKSDSGKFGVAVSAAYQRLKTLELGNNTVRWSQAPFDSVNGSPCYFNTTGNAATGVTYTTPRGNAGGSYRPSAACDQATLSFHPRIPRYGEVAHDRERLGITGSVQWAPSDATKVSIDGLFSRFKADREEKWGEVLLRGNERSIDVLNPVYDSNNNMISATLNDAWVRTEHYLRESETTFYQLGGSWDQDVSDTFRFTVLGGFSKSDADVPKETTFVFDDRDAQGYFYDYSNMEFPKLTFGTSVTDPANFQLAEIRDRPSNVTNTVRTAQIRTEWDAVPDALTIKTGAVYRRFRFDSQAFLRDTVVCGNGGVDRVLGTLACSPTSAFGPGTVYGFPAANLGELFTMGRAGQPAGTTTEFLIPDLQKSADFTNLYGRTATVDPGNTRSVTEEVKGAYLQFDVKGELLGLRYAANAGMRYAHTDQSSTGLASGVPVTLGRTYDDWLPSMNVALFPAEDVIIRGAIAKVITRPSLGNLTPGGSVDGFNYNVSFGNPNLLPFRATAFDLAFEWYFAPQSIFSVALFKKDVESFPIGVTTNGTFASTGLPTSIIPPASPAAQPGQLEQRPWNITSVTNGTGATLKGVEVSLQLPFTFLPGFLKNFGGIVNGTLIDSDASYRVNGAIQNACVRNATTGLCGLGPNVQATRSTTLFGLSKKAVNGTLYYEDAKFSARVSGAFREGYVDGNSGTGNVFEGYGDTLNVDASIRYKLTDWIEVSLEGVNLTDEYRFRYTDLDAQRNYENNHFGRTILVGARFKL